MPIYAYRCSACGYAKDVLQKMSDPVLSECPQCHASTFRKQLTAAGFQLKGSGWYVTDFRGGDHKPKGPAEPADGAPAATGDAAGGKSDAPAPTGGGEPSASTSSGPSDAKAETHKAEAKKAAPTPTASTAAAPPPASK